MQTEERRPTPDEIPEQKLDYPASQRDMIPQPDSDLSNYSPANKFWYWSSSRDRLCNGRSRSGYFISRQ